MKYHGKGFTLIELLLVVGLVGLLLVWATPQFLTFNRRQVLQSAADKVVADLKDVQSLAEGGVAGSSTNRYLYSVASPAPGSGYLLCQDDCSSGELDSVTPTSPVCIKDSSPSTFGFEVPTGQLVNLSGGSIGAAVSFDVCYPDNDSVGKFTVTVEPGGRIFRSSRQGVSCSCS